MITDDQRCRAHPGRSRLYQQGDYSVLPEPALSSAPLSYHSELEVEHEPAEMVADQPATIGTTLHVVRDTPTPTAEALHKQQSSVPDDESTVTSQAAIAQVAPAKPEGGRRGSFVSLLGMRT
jgi:hypothetical protein